MFNPYILKPFKLLNQNRLLGCPGKEGVVPLDLPIALNFANACSLKSARSSASSRSTWAFLNLAKFNAAISSASSICLLKHRTYRKEKAPQIVYFRLVLEPAQCLKITQKFSFLMQLRHTSKMRHFLQNKTLCTVFENHSKCRI